MITKRELSSLKIGITRKNQPLFLNNLLKSGIFTAHVFFRFHF